MARIKALTHEETTGAARAAYDEGMAKWNRMTNLKRTLLNSPTAYRIYMEWYTLLDIIKPFLGDRLPIIFAHAVSSGSGCLICTTFMRRILIDWGEDPNHLKLDEKGKTLVDFGRAIAKQGNRVPEELYKKLASFFTPEQILILTAFAGQMVATNIVNNALEVELDEYLYEYREGQPLKKAAVKSGGH